MQDHAQAVAVDSQTDADFQPAYSVQVNHFQHPLIFRREQFEYAPDPFRRSFVTASS